MLPNKLAVAHSFSRAAARYDQSAMLQRRVGHQLLAYLPSFLPDHQVMLDLGCGTGYFLNLLSERYPSSHVMGLDLSEGMLQQVKQQHQKNKLILGDAEQLPIREHSVDVVFSNLTLQWCHDFSRVLVEVYRILKPQGMFLFTTLCDGTLFELKQSWQAADDDIHVNHFLPLVIYQQQMTDSAFTIQQTKQVTEVAYYQTVYDVMRSLKGIGANNMNPERRRGLTGHNKLNQVVQAYECFRQEAGIPSTYQVLMGFLIKSV